MKKSGKKWITFDFEVDSQKSAKNPSDTMDFDNPEKLTKKTEICAFPIQKKRPFNFEHSLRPRTIADLAVHPKKIKEVQAWLENNAGKNPAKCTKFLLITGPTGCGKTSTVRVLCENMSIDVCEWVNPMDHDFEIFRGPNQVTKFLDFLTESKWNSLFSMGSNKVILAEEFPNALLRNPEDFKNVLEECYYKGNFPVIFICADSFDSGKNLSETLFPQEIRAKYQISQINFNPCAPTLIKNALKRAHNLVQDNLDLFKTPSHNTVDAIIASTMGDIRCAINQFYFASLLGTSELPTTAEKNSGKSGAKRKRNETNSSIRNMTRDENLGLFHGLGRILNPKRTEIGGSQKLNCDIEKLVDEFSIRPGIFTLFLFENYVKYFGDINDACKASEILSFSQIFLEKWDSHDTLVFALWTSILGLMLCNNHKVSKWTQIRAPTKINKRVNRDQETRNLTATDLFYYNIITKSQMSSSFRNI